MSTVSSLTRDPSIWLEDGNVVIVTQDTAFRVHRGLLSRHSEVFSGLFTLAQPDDQASVELYDGCPVIPVPDSSHDFRHLLHAIYDGLSFVEAEHENKKFSVYAALARLGDKYGLPHIFTAATKWLGAIFTDTYTVWHALWTKYGSTNNIISNLAINPFEAANLFRITGQDRMRPIALFMCCQLDIPILLSGLPRADGAMEVLSSDDLRRCLEARVRYTAEMTTFMHMFYFVTADAPVLGCTTPDICPNAFDPERDDHRTHVFSAHDSYYQNPFKISVSMCRKITDDKRRVGALCGLCADYLLEHMRDLGRSHWNALVENMGLEECVEDWGLQGR